MFQFRLVDWLVAVVVCLVLTLGGAYSFRRSPQKHIPTYKGKPAEWDVSYCDCGYHIYRKGYEIVVDHDVAEKWARAIERERRLYRK